MNYKKIALEDDFVFTKIKSTNERLYLFQLSDQDLTTVREIISNNPFVEEFIFKEKKIINSLTTLTTIQKNNYHSIILNYLENLGNTNFDEQYFFSRKRLGYELENQKIDSTILSSTFTRLIENFLYALFEKKINDKELLFDQIIIVQNFFNFEKEIITKFLVESETNELLSNINKMLTEILQIDFLPEIKQKISKIKVLSENVNKNSRVLTEASENNKTLFKDLVVESNYLSRTIEENKTNIETSIDDIFLINNDFRKTEATINDLVMNIRTINSIITTIKSISEQTTLLAINASIEASRAEAEGKGFSVIAEEIRDLSEQTTDSVEKITNIIQKFEENAHRLDKNTKDVIGRLNNKTKKTETAMINLNSIFDVSSKILKTIFSISKDLEFEDKKMNSIVTSSEELKNNTNDIYSSVLKTSREIFDASQAIFETKEDIENNIKNVRHSEILNLFSINSKKLYWEIYNKQIGANTNDVSIEEYDKNFTKHYLEISKNNLIADTSISKDLKLKHDEIIYYGEKILFLLQKKNNKEAEIELLNFKKFVTEFNIAAESLINFI